MSKPRTAKEVRCRMCDEGRHDDCTERACYCHCMLPSMPARSLAVATARTHRDITYVLQRLKDHGVIARLAGEGMDWWLVWKPNPKKLPDEIRALITQYRRELTRVLVPSGTPLPRHRPYWTLGVVRACVCCGTSSAQYNPLGECMHGWCGYLSQKPAKIAVVQVPMYPKAG